MFPAFTLQMSGDATVGQPGGASSDADRQDIAFAAHAVDEGVAGEEADKIGMPIIYFLANIAHRPGFVTDIIEAAVKLTLGVY